MRFEPAVARIAKEQIIMVEGFVHCAARGTCYMPEPVSRVRAEGALSNRAMRGRTSPNARPEIVRAGLPRR